VLLAIKQASFILLQQKIKESSNAIAALERIEQDYTAALNGGLMMPLGASGFCKCKSCLHKALGINQLEKIPKVR